MNIKNYRLWSLARIVLNAVGKVIEVRGGIMLSMSLPAMTNMDGPAGLRCIENLEQIEESWHLQLETVAKRLNQGHVV